MKIFLDSANIDELKTVSSFGIVDGVTTNPSLIAKEGRPTEDQVRLICELIDGDVSAEAIATDVKGMVREGRSLARIHQNIVVKLPLTQAGIAATAELSKEGVRVNVTLCFSPAQAILAAKAGAYIVSPFIGRSDDLGWPGLQMLEEIVAIYSRQRFATQVLATSIRTSRQVVEAAKMGAQIVTLTYKTLEQMFHHPLTDKGLDRFLADYNSAFETAKQS